MSGSSRRPRPPNNVPILPEHALARALFLKRGALLVSGWFCEGKVALAGVQDPVDVPDEVVDQHAALGDVGERAVAAVGDCPGGASGGRCRVAAFGAELAVVVLTSQQLEGLGAERGRRGLLAF